MSWFTTADTGQFLAAAGEFLRAEPARNSVMLTVTENLRVKAAAQAPAAVPTATAPGTNAPPWTSVSAMAASRSGRLAASRSRSSAGGGALRRPGQSQE